MALMLVLSLGAKTARTGFDLGRRALASADSAVAQDEFRAIVHGLELAPAGADARSLGLRPLTGDAQALTANVVLDRSGHCGPAGPAGVLRLSVASGAGGDVLICQTQFGAPATVLDARPRRIRLEYSPDGTTWAESWSAPQSSAGLSKPLAEQVVFVRLVSADGKIDLVERASSGPAFFYPSLIAPNLIGPSLVAPVHP